MSGGSRPWRMLPRSSTRRRRKASADPDLSFILTELRNLDHQHWSALLAELVQDRLVTSTPGPTEV